MPDCQLIAANMIEQAIEQSIARVGILSGQLDQAKKLLDANHKLVVFIKSSWMELLLEALEVSLRREELHFVDDVKEGVDV
jgi:hypothetical protein